MCQDRAGKAGGLDEPMPNSNVAELRSRAFLSRTGRHFPAGSRHVEIALRLKIEACYRAAYDRLVFLPGC